MAVPALRSLERTAHIRALLRGYQALAPAPPALERGREAQWTAASEAAARLAQQTTPPPRIAAAVWLAIELGRQGMRPKAALRAAMGQSRRVRLPSGMWEVHVHLDKDNPVGAVPACRRRRLPAAMWIDRAMAALPLQDDEWTAAVAERRRLLLAEGVRTLYSARRDAGTAAERRGGTSLAAAVLNHKPNSATTPIYTGTTTPTSTLHGLVRATQGATHSGR